MNKQQIFDKVVTHLYAQGEPAIGPGGGACYYRTNPTGSKELSCAVGCLISDNLYDPKMEGLPVFNVSNVWPEALKGLIGPRDQLQSVYTGDTRTRLKLLSDLQRIHDSRCVIGWELKLIKIARRYKLNQKALKIAVAKWKEEANA